MKRSAALWLQPKHLRSVARNAESVETLHAVCELVINGQVPELAKQWLYVHKVVALSKLSSHQKGTEERLQAQAAGNGDEYTASARPVAIGDALLRLAEKALATKVGKVLFVRVLAHG